MRPKKRIALLVVGLLFLAIVPTIVFLQSRKDIRQHADTHQATVVVTPQTAAAGSTLTVQWTLHDTATSSATSTDMFTGAEILQLINTKNNTPVGSFIYLNCESVNTNSSNVDHNTMPASAIVSGQCSYHIPKKMTAGSYLIRMLASDGTTVLGESSLISISSSQKETKPTISAWPNPCLLTDYGICSSLISWNVPNATNAADVTVKVKGLKNSLFANAPYGSEKAGWITSEGATFELYIGSSATPVSSVSVKGIDSLPVPTARPFAKDTPPPLPSITPTNIDTSGCMKDSDCGQSDHPGSTVMKCFRYGDYAGTCKPADTVCTQSVTTACYQRQANCFGEGEARGCTQVYFPERCDDFPNKCVIPPGWYEK